MITLGLTWGEFSSLSQARHSEYCPPYVEAASRRYSIPIARIWEINSLAASSADSISNKCITSTPRNFDMVIEFNHLQANISFQKFSFSFDTAILLSQRGHVQIGPALKSMAAKKADGRPMVVAYSPGIIWPQGVFVPRSVHNGDSGNNLTAFYYR